MPKDKGPSQIKFFIGMTLAIFLVLFARLGYLQIAQGNHLAVQSDQNRLRLLRINAPRGVFYDRNRVPLVTSRLAFSLIAVPEALVNPRQELARAAALLQCSLAELEKKLAAPDRRPYEGVALATNLDQGATLRLAEAEGELPGMMLQEMPVRYYPRGEFAAHLFGYVGEINAPQLAERKD